MTLLNEQTKAHVDLTLEAIKQGSFDSDLRRIKEACEMRLKVAKKNTLKVGSKVRVGNIRPRYVCGAVGTVITINTETATIDLDSPCWGPTTRTGRRCYHKGIRIPLSGLEALPPQVNFNKTKMTTYDFDAATDIPIFSTDQLTNAVREAVARAGYQVGNVEITQQDHTDVTGTIEIYEHSRLDPLQDDSVMTWNHIEVRINGIATLATSE